MAQRTEREVLNHLIESCRDGELGFKTAAEHVTDPTLKSLFITLAEDRARCAQELLPHAQRLGGANVSDGTSVGALHRKWIDVKSTLTGHHHDHAIFIEVARGDRVTVHAFKDAIEGILPPDTRDVVERQYAVIQNEHERLMAAEGEVVH
jgi:uncharacterized protein (TIGR02284 family)